MASAGAVRGSGGALGRGSGPGRRARLAASAASAWRVPIRPASAARLLAEDQGAVGLRQSKAGKLLRAGALRGLEATTKRRGARRARRGWRAGRTARLRTGGAARRCARPRRAAAAVRRRISGMVAASSERTWTASRTEPGWTSASAAGRRVIVCKAAVSRITGPCRSARRARCSPCSAAISAIRRSAAVRSASAASIRAASASAAARARSASLTARRACSSSCW